MKSRRAFASALLAPLLSVGIALAFALPILAQDDSPFYWEALDVEIVLQENGDMMVSERHTYVFTAPHTNQRHRYIPLDRVDGIDQVAVYQDDVALEFETGVEDGQRWILWSHDLNPPETHTFVIRYRVRGGLQQEGDTGAIYWKALFADRQAEISRGSVTALLPRSLDGRVGEYRSFGARAEARLIHGHAVEFNALSPLAPGEELVARVEFPSEALPEAFPPGFSFTWPWRLAAVLATALSAFSAFWILLRILRMRGLSLIGPTRVWLIAIGVTILGVWAGVFWVREILIATCGVLFLLLCLIFGEHASGGGSGGGGGGAGGGGGGG